MNILFLTCFRKNSAGNIYGGAEKSITNLANWFAHKRRYRVSLVSIEGDVFPYYVDKDVCHFGCNIKYKSKILRHLAIFFNTWRTIRNSNADVIVSFWIQPLFYALFFKPRNVKLFYSERNDPRLEYGLVARIMRWFVLRSASGVVFQTQDAMGYFNKKIIQKSIVIHNPVYITDAQYPIKKPDNRIVAVGRLNAQKNYFLLLRAFEKISREYPLLTLEIYGEGILRNDLQNFIEQHRMSKKIFLKGAYKNVVDLIYGAKLFVMTSLYEGMPNALMEAMALGIPVICSDCPCGGPRELIETGKNGYLFENGNFDELVSKMKKILDEGDLSNLINEERMICKTHSSDFIFSQWDEFFKRL